MWKGNKQCIKTKGSLPDVRVEKQLHSASSVGCRAADWEQDSHREREKCSAVTQAGLSRATTSRQSARKTQSSAIILKGRNTYISFTDMSSLRGSTAAAQSPSDQLAGGPYASSPTIAFSAFVWVSACVCVQLEKFNGGHPVRMVFQNNFRARK